MSANARMEHGMVVVENVHKWFGSVHAVRGVSFDLPAGTVAGLLGHNGAGKSTTIRMIAGYITPDAGRVSIAGHDMTHQRLHAARQMGYLPESTPLYPEMPTRDYLDFRGRLFGLSREARRKRVDEVIERCWLKDVRARRVGQLSKGYKQRVGLAASLLHEPRVLLLDEPTSGLDPSQVRETRDLVRELAQDRTMLISSHVLPEVEAICNRVIIFAGGKVRAAGGVQELASSTGTAGYVIEAKHEGTRGSDAADALLALRNAMMRVPGVSDIAMTSVADGWTRVQVQASREAGDLREPLARAMPAGTIVRELRAKAASLESIFMRVLEQAAREEGTLAPGAGKQSIAETAATNTAAPSGGAA
jgi:ABC-2 type transport system ATP-binding protein